MSFIKLGNTLINYIESLKSINYIISDIIDSSLSPEYPKLIKNILELDLYFNLDEVDSDKYDFYCKLLNSGNTLYLYKPLSNSPNNLITNYINYSDWPVVNVLDYDNLPGNLNNELPQKNTIYQLESTSTKYIYLIENSNDGMWIDIDNLPENFSIPENSSSWTNRDSLSVTSISLIKDIHNPNDYSDRPYITSNLYPSFLNYYTDNVIDYSDIQFSYDFEEKSSRYFSRDSVLHYISCLNNYLLDSSFSITLDFSLIKNSELEDAFIVILLTKDNINSSNIFFSINPKTNLSIDIYNLIDDTNYKKRFYEITGNCDEIINLIISILTTKLSHPKNISCGGGFKIDKLVNRKLSIYSDKLIRLYKFSNIESLIISNNYLKSLDIVDWATRPIIINTQKKPLNDYYYIIKDNNKIIVDNCYRVLDFYSKLLGYSGESLDNLITISVLKSDYYTEEYPCYLILISKKNYFELYEGLLAGPSSVGDLINSKSKLVQVYTHTYYKHSYEDNLDNIVYPKINCGTWKMAGSLPENISILSRWTSLNILKESNIQEDFFLVDDMDKWVLDKEHLLTSYYLEYLNLLDYAKTKNTQILILNTDNNYQFNYTLDSYNYLIYFYKNFTLSNYRTRPGYFLFVLSILSNSWNIDNNIIFNNIDNTGLIEGTSIIATTLEKFKCNYLIKYNNHFAYKKFFWGENYTLTGTSRFIQSRLTRKILINKWDLLNNNNINLVKLNSILGELKHQLSSLIYSIDIQSTSIDSSNLTASIVIELKLREFLEKDIILNITINYSN